MLFLLCPYVKPASNLIFSEAPLTTFSPVTGRRLDYTSFSVDIGVTDMTKNSRLFTVTSTTCSTLLLAVFFPPIDIQQAHPVSVPIRHASDKSSVVTRFETGVCMHRKYTKIPGT